LRVERTTEYTKYTEWEVGWGANTEILELDRFNHRERRERKERLRVEGSRSRNHEIDERTAGCREVRSRQKNGRQKDRGSLAPNS
jgi:hypothetical protein